MYHILESETPINEAQLAELAAKGFELLLCVPHSGRLFWYFRKAN